MNNNIDMTARATKPEDNWCRCCHSEGSFKNLHTTYFWLDVEKVVYSDVLRECFNIELLEVREASHETLCAICYTCIQRLADAVKFKRQIQNCEKLFREVYSGFSKDKTRDVTTKEEILDPEDTTQDVTTKEEILDPEETMIFESIDCPNGDITSTAIDNGNNASDEGIHDSDTDFNFNPDIENEEDISEQVGSRAKCKKTETTTKVKKNNKIQKKPKPVKEKVSDVIKGSNTPRRVTLVEKNVDFIETEETYQCLMCPASVRKEKKATGIRNHIRIVHFNISRYRCHYCPERFRSPKCLFKHNLEKHNVLGDKVKCDICGFETYTKQSLERHLVNHSAVKSHKCKFCKKAFKRANQKNCHEMIHTGEKRKLCAVCGQAFVQRASLKYHMIKHHPGVDF